MVVSSPDLELNQDSQFKTSVRERLRQYNPGFESTNGTGKKPVYSLLISESSYRETNDPSELGGAAGAVLAGTTAHAVLGDYLATGAAGFVGWLAGTFFFEEKFHVWTFEIRVRQRTSAQGLATIKSRHGNNVRVTQKSTDGDVDKVTSAEALDNVSKETVFNVASNVLERVRVFTVVVKGRGMNFSREDAAALAREKVAVGIPELLFGSTLF